MPGVETSPVAAKKRGRPAASAQSPKVKLNLCYIAYIVQTKLKFMNVVE